MMSRSHLEILWASFSLGVKQAAHDKITLIGSFIVYATIILLYGGVIKQIPDADLVKHGYTHAQMIWYLAMTEFVLFACTSWGFKEVQAEFWSEQIHLSLLRPYPTSLQRVALWGGESFVRVLAQAVPAFLFIWALAGSCPLTAAGAVGFMLSIPLSVFIMQCAIYMIGASCLWFVQAEPAFWVWQKAIFLIGAMIWPMAFYPVWATPLMWATPFPAILAQAGEWVLDPSAVRMALGFVHQAFWALAAYLLLRRYDALVIRKLQSGEV